MKKSNDKKQSSLNVDKNIKLTYFTPTYNRANLLPNLYKCLCNQTNKDFIWLIIDDGSVDNTEEIVNNWQKQNKIKIQYVKKENGGKNTTIDLSNKICKTEYICCIDSDDTISENATEILYSKFSLCDKENICGLVGLKASKDTKTNWNFNNSEICFYDLGKTLSQIPETILIFKTEIAKKFNFPHFENEKFITESVYYQQFLYDYKLIAFDEIIYYFEYLSDGYTKQGINLYFKNPKGYAYALKQNAYLAIKQRKPFKIKIKKVLSYYGWIKFNKISNKFTLDYELPKFYRFLGSIFSPITSNYYKKRYNSVQK